MERREASLQVCAVECRAKCCRNPREMVQMALSEAQLLQAIAYQRQIRVKWRPLIKKATGEVVGYGLAFQDHPGARCPFLDDISSLCTVYNDRPKACRCFPHKPWDGCLVWPLPQTKGDSNEQ